MRKLWRLWAQALGEKSGESDSEADAIARFRTLLILQGVITNILISINILISWLKCQKKFIGLQGLIIQTHW